MDGGGRRRCTDRRAAALAGPAWLRALAVIAVLGSLAAWPLGVSGQARLPTVTSSHHGPLPADPEPELGREGGVPGPLGWRQASSRPAPGGQAADAGPDPGRAFAYSALLPGAGQFVMGQRRWFAYLLLEAAGWAYWLDRRGRGHDLRDRYRDLAWTTARTAGTGPRTDGDFAYYETLVHWDRSGRWDRDPSSPELDPENDPATFNGSIWLLARQLYFPLGPDSDVGTGDPAWDDALGYYRTRAYGPAFLWDWTPYPGERTRFAGLIEKSDDRLREATIALGLVTANHVLSAADAFVSARLRDATGDRLDAALRLGDGPGPEIRGTPWGSAGLPPVVVEIRLRR